jgi:hypothetical protein
MKNQFYISTNSNIISRLIKIIILKSKKKNYQNICPVCNKIFYTKYYYKKNNTQLKIKEKDIHLLLFHNMILYSLYKKICSLKLSNSTIQWYLLTTNNINIIDGLYEFGSNQIYLENNKDLTQTKISRFSEHSGLIYFEKKKVSDISINTDMRVEKSDPLIYMPKNCLDALKVSYLFHTHPKTPFIGSRIKDGIIYEFPSISDIIHFVEHHNSGKLLGSIIVSPEGIYIIRKNNFNKKNIVIDYDIMINKIEEIYLDCFNESYLKYSSLNFDKFKKNDEINLPEDIFYKQIANDYTWINKINDELIKYDLFIDYYARSYFDKTDIFTNKKWIFNDIYLPFIN